jgi:hypothetical protein
VTAAGRLSGIVTTVAVAVLVCWSAPAVAARGAARCAHVERPPTGSTTVTLQDADAGKTVCVQRGDEIDVFLHAAAIPRWSAVRSSSNRVLAPKATGRLALPVGVTGAVYAVEGRGRARLASHRAPCAPPRPRGCDAAHRWTVRVSAR